MWLLCRSGTLTPATSFDLYVRGLLPTTTGVTLGQIAQVNLTGSEKYFIYWFHNPLTQFLFNSSTLLPGQRVAIGGSASGAANASAVTTNRIVLRHWGFNGTVVANSINPGNGTFQIKINGFAGLLVPQTVTVYTASRTDFRYGFKWNEQRHRRCECARGRPADQGPNLRATRCCWRIMWTNSTKSRLTKQNPPPSAGTAFCGSGAFLWRGLRQQAWRRRAFSEGKPLSPYNGERKGARLRARGTKRYGEFAGLRW